MIKAILLAAGQSKRMKSENKLIKLYKKKPLINYSLNVLKKSKANKIVIVLGHQFKEVKKIIKKNKKIIFTYNKNYKKGMASSIKVGLKKVSKKANQIIEKLEIKFIRIKDIDDPDKLLEKLFDLYKYVLVRPDLYVYGGSNENDFSEMIESIDKSFELI